MMIKTTEASPLIISSEIFIYDFFLHALIDSSTTHVFYHQDALLDSSTTPNGY